MPGYCITGAGLIALPGGIFATSAKPNGTILHSFVLENTSTTTATPGFARQGVVFCKGDVPSGHAVQVQRGGSVIAAQLDDRTSWSDGSLKRAVLHLRDTAFAASESRSYDLTIIAGSFDNTGTKTLADVTGAHSFSLAFNNIQQYDGTTESVHGSGTFAADFNTHAGVATRIEKTHSGAVCEGWKVWGMAHDTTGGAEDAHLKVNWYVDLWKNSDGSVADVEIGPVISQDWWSIANKLRLDYDVTLSDGATTVVAYTGVHHFYHGQWLVGRSVQDNDESRRSWLGTIPTLHYKLDRAYWIASGLIPPYDLSLSVTSNPLSAYHFVPLGAIAHRAGVDSTGGYQGRGNLPQSDAIAFLRQTAADTAIARLNAHAGLHIPYHYRSNRQRTRPGDNGVADVANSLISVKMAPLAPSAYDFTADGLPIAVYACTDYRTPTDHMDGYVAPLGGTAPWTPSGDPSHAVNYSGFMWLFDGERHFLEAALDLAMAVIHQLVGNIYGSMPPLINSAVQPYQTMFNIPATIYESIAVSLGQERALGWACNLWHVAGTCPDAHEAGRFVRTCVAHQGQWLSDSLRYIPTSEKRNGVLAFNATQVKTYCSPWMDNFQTLGGLYNYRCTETPGMLELGSMTANIAIGQAAHPAALAENYRNARAPLNAPWDPLTNDYFPADAVFEAGWQATFTAGSATVTLTPNGGTKYLSVGDIVYAQQYDGSANLQSARPPEFRDGWPHYVVSVSGTAVQLAYTPGGAAIVFSAAWSGEAATRPSTYDTLTVAAYPPYLPGGDSYTMISRAALVIAYCSGIPGATSALVNNMMTYTSSVDLSSIPQWAYGPPT